MDCKHPSNQIKREKKEIKPKPMENKMSVKRIFIIEGYCIYYLKSRI